MNRYFGVMLVWWGIMLSAGSIFGAESPYLLPAGPKNVQPSASVVDVLYQQAQRHADRRDQAYFKLEDAGTGLDRQFWLTTMVKEEASRLLMLIRAMKELRQVDTRQRERLHNLQLLAVDPQVKSELAGMENMLSKIRELAAGGSAGDEQEFDQIEQNLAVLCRMYSPEYTAGALAREQVEPESEFRFLALQYSQLQQQFDSLAEGENI